ncbi:MAG: T9SS type A sorting domain-containing protein, partial [Candidatus Latescibacterota bacterium]
YFPPTISSIAPNSGDNDEVVAITDLLGGDIIYGANFLLRDASMTEYPATNVEWIGHAKLVGDLNLNGMPGGTYDVVLRSPDGQEAVLVDGFTVHDGVPVFISEFGATAREHGVDLSWAVMSDEKIWGFRIYRGVEHSGTSADITPAGLVPPNARTYRDESVIGGRRYEYTLSVVLEDRSEIRSQTVTVRTKARRLTLLQNHPNPFNPSTTIAFSLNEKAETELAIYNIEGRLVRTLVDDTLDEGFKRITWDGKDAHGNHVSSGVYFYRLTAGNRTLTKKMVLLK